jgi:hypothetical protein
MEATLHAMEELDLQYEKLDKNPTGLLTL